MRKVGFLWIGHEDYLGETTAAIQRKAMECVQDITSIHAQAQPIAVTDAQAVAAARALVEVQDCCGAIIVLTSWVECNVVMSALKELRGRPCMFWGFPVEELDGKRDSTGSYVSASMFAGVVRRLGLHCSMLIASWKDPAAHAQLACFAKAACAIDALYYAKIGLFGYTSMRIYTGTFDHVLMRYQIGPEVDQMDTYSLLRAAEAVSDADVDAALKRLGTVAHIQDDAAPEMLRKTMALYVALRRFCQEKEWAAVNIKCQYELSKEYKAVPCVALSLLADDGITASCEGDMLNTVSMLLLQLLAQKTVWYGDSLTHWDNTVQFSPCGFMPFSMACGVARVQKFLEHPGFAGVQVCGVLRPEKVTYLRLVEDIGTYHLLYGTGTGTQTLPRGGCMPALNVILDGDVRRLCQEYAGQHFALVYGDLSQEIEQYAALTGLEARRI